MRQAFAAFIGSLLISFAAVAAEAPTASTDPLPRAKPEDVGISRERLARIGAALKDDLNSGLTQGSVVVTERRRRARGGRRPRAGGGAAAGERVFFFFFFFFKKKKNRRRRTAAPGRRRAAAPAARADGGGVVLAASGRRRRRARGRPANGTGPPAGAAKDRRSRICRATHPA